MAYVWGREFAMLLFDDSKRLEKALGEEAASVIAHVFEQADEKLRRELATKADLLAAKFELQSEIQAIRNVVADTKHEILKWVIGMAVAQSALIIAVISFLK
jgi:hypothetical protein